jgi:hypothetical protein
MILGEGLAVTVQCKRYVTLTLEAAVVYQGHQQNPIVLKMP